MSILDTFYILFDSDASKLDKGLGDSEKKADSLIDKLRGVDKEGAKAGAGLYKMVAQGASLLGVGMSIGALIAGVKSTAAAYTQLEKLALQFRSTAEAVDEFRDAAGLIGITEEQSVGALKSLEAAVQDTFLGMGRAKKVFEELGISVTDAAGKIKPTTDVMGELATKFKDMDKGTQIRVMERLGLDPALLKLFNADMVELQRRMAEVDRASGFNLEAAVKRSAEFTKASKSLGLEVNVLRMYLEKMIEGFKVSTMPFFTEAMTTATKYVRMFVEYIMQHSRFVEGVLIAIGGAILYFIVPAAIKGALAVWAMIAPFALVAAAVIAAGVAFALIYDDIMNFIEGGDSMIGAIVNKWPIIGDIARGIADTLKMLWQAGVTVFDFFVDMWNDPAAAFRAFLDLVLGGIKAILSAIPGVSSALKYLGFNSETGAALSAGKVQLGTASASPLSAQSSTSIANSSRKQTSVNVGKVEVHTQATDAAGISKAIGGTMETQMRQTVNNFDDGVLA